MNAGNFYRCGRANLALVVETGDVAIALREAQTYEEKAELVAGLLPKYGKLVDCLTQPSPLGAGAAQLDKLEEELLDDVTQYLAKNPVTACGLRGGKAPVRDGRWLRAGKELVSILLPIFTS